MTIAWQLTDRKIILGPRPLVMGIVNVTPDSFSDGGQFFSAEAGVNHALTLIGEGADILDIGGESTRPGSQPVTREEELNRVLPVVEALLKQTAIPLSVDTSKAEVARQCLERRAHIINDVTALTGDPAMLDVVAKFRPGVVLMHMQGTPATMQIDPRYDDVVDDIICYFQERMQALIAKGLALDHVALDPGIGFGKTRHYNLEILARLGEFQRLNRPVCLGVSRKGFLGKILDRTMDQRLPGSLGAICFAQAQGAMQIVRVHDVAATRDAVTVIAAIQEAGQKPDLPQEIGPAKPPSE